jgi:osmotically-inducible protein OsmY
MGIVRHRDSEHFICDIRKQHLRHRRTASAPDDRIVDQVRMRLATDADVKGSALEVRAKHGVVTIKGTVDTPKAKKRAEQLTRKVKGVKDVINELVVRQESR